MSRIQDAMAAQNASLIMPVDEDDSLALGILPGTGTIVCAGGKSLFSFVDQALTIRTIEHEILDDCDDAMDTAHVLGLPNGRFLAMNIQKVTLLALRGEKLVEEASWDLQSRRSMSVTIGVCADAMGETIAVCENDFLHLLHEDGSLETVEVGKDNDIWGVTISADGRQIVNGRHDGSLEIRDAKTLEVTEVLKGLQMCPMQISFSPDGKWLVASDDMAKCMLWNLQTKETIQLPVWSKAIGLHWMSDSSGFVIAGLSRVLDFIDVNRLGELSEQTHHSFSFEQIGWRYVQSSVLRDDENLFTFAEKAGLVHIKLGR